MKTINLKYLLYAVSLVLMVSTVQANEGRGLKDKAAAFASLLLHRRNPQQQKLHSAKKCVYERTAGEPSDPAFPIYWTSEWTMYRVFNNYDKFPPPYALPPAG